MNGQNRTRLTPKQEQEVRFWVDALLHGGVNPANAAHQLYSIGVRTRGAVRTRGSVRAAAPSRFPPGTPVSEILKLLQTEAEPGLRGAVAGALAEWGGAEALDLLRQLVQDKDEGVRSAALDAIGIIGGPEAVTTLEKIASSGDDPVLRSMARSSIEALRQG